MTVHERVIADLGLSGHELVEPCLATTRTRRFAAYRSIGNVMRAASATSQSATWRADDIQPPGGGFNLQDATVAVVDPSLDTFVVFAITSAFGGSPALRYCTFAPTSGFTAWTTAHEPDPGIIETLDKPWVVRRTASDFYVFFYKGNRYEYLRSSSGTTWTGLQPVSVATSEGLVQGKFCLQPSVAADGRIFAAYATATYGPLESGKVRILIGEAGAGGLTFTHMRRQDGSILEFAPRRPQYEDLPAPSGPDGTGEIKSKTVPYLVCDPSDWRRAYIAYHDTAADDDFDVNVYLARLQWESPGHWNLVSNVPIHDDVTSASGVRADQVIPTPIVDAAGRVHVVFYDNRPHCGLTGFWVEYDAWLATSVDQGATFTRRNLRTNCDADPAMDLGLPAGQLTMTWSPLEYNGAAVYQRAEETLLWVIYAGTSLDPEDDPTHRSVLFGQQIVVTSSP